MEYAAGGELFERICNAGRFSEDEVTSIVPILNGQVMRKVGVGVVGLGAIKLTGFLKELMQWKNMNFESFFCESYSSLKCRSTTIEYIWRGKPDVGFALFESESLKWPGFVEFDDVNGKVLTYSAQDSVTSDGYPDILLRCT
ncbi:hypothetical protein K1719_032525 [Acacia pycnantha]|nr:hypothetical protein K1719_032525 [Acacia pycnantha]